MTHRAPLTLLSSPSSPRGDFKWEISPRDPTGTQSCPEGGSILHPSSPQPLCPSPLRATSTKPPRSHSRRMRSAAASAANASRRQGDGNTWADMPASEGLKDYPQQHKHCWRGCHARLRGTASCGGCNPPKILGIILGMHPNAGDPLPSSALLSRKPHSPPTLSDAKPES